MHFSILIHDEFHDSAPVVWQEYDELTEAVSDFNKMKTNYSRGMYEDGIELVTDTEDERICLEYHRLKN